MFKNSSDDRNLQNRYKYQNSIERVQNYEIWSFS